MQKYKFFLKLQRKSLAKPIQKANEFAILSVKLSINGGGYATLVGHGGMAMLFFYRSVYKF